MVDARAIAVRLRLGNPSSPIMNTAMTGAFSRASALVPLDSIIEAIREVAPAEKERNATAARKAYEAVKQIIPPQTGKGAL
jgi:Pyruvate/2-oxoacid:ferredoxin oxidoreductase gamma subunit